MKNTVLSLVFLFAFSLGASNVLSAKAIAPVSVNSEMMSGNGALDDIADDVKEAGKEVAKASKKVAKKTKKAAKKAGKSTKKAAKKAGKEIKKGFNEVKKAIKE